MPNSSTAIKTIKFSLLSSILLAVIKGLAGFFGNSYALIADAIESLADVLSSVLVFFGLKYAQRPPDENHPYGHGRIEPLVTFVVVGFLVLAAFVITYQAIYNILHPKGSPEAWTLYILGGIILWKEASFRYVINKSKETGSSSLKADAWNHRSDAITSIAGFIGISIAVVFGEGYEAADDWAALVAAAFILYNSYLIFRPALGEIMDEHAYDDLIDEIRKVAVQVDGILYTEKCFVRKVGMIYHVDIHASVDGDLTVTEGHEIAHQLKDKLKEEFSQLGNVLVHIEPGCSTS